MGLLLLFIVLFIGLLYMQYILMEEYTGGSIHDDKTTKGDSFKDLLLEEIDGRSNHANKPPKEVTPKTYEPKGKPGLRSLRRRHNC